eukprot:1059103_1
MDATTKFNQLKLEFSSFSNSQLTPGKFVHVDTQNRILARDRQDGRQEIVGVRTAQANIVVLRQIAEGLQLLHFSFEGASLLQMSSGGVLRRRSH